MGQAKRRNRKKTAPALPNISLAEWKARISAMPWRDVCKSQWQAVSTKVTPYWQLLPGFHRKALMVLVPVVIVLLLLPASEPELKVPGGEPARQEVSLNLSETPREAEQPQRQRAPISSTIHPLNAEQRSDARPKPEAKPATVTSQSQSGANWRSYEVKQGETLATIFRSKSLPLTDLYAIAAIEGKDKPLSQIKSGQLLRYKQLANGDLDVLQIESRSGDPVMFFRRSDGSFVRGK
ncbi:LysM-like peptidoglycan-binding domain-containing protein [Photobacterium sp. 1_MG-2023]|uniref:LysM-like peptidoglycan-binding domain-containing protein n=1 Tax=Photobacterium sp. 1_MG-2023 TaxID=3062646 RepID=UPI0026E27800|nr:LysM-like peptidoglycan-binding domain-containing protein [Photobacterium sp. 1_MG-2023]MDO6708787.1 LysM-like peptidoglycan-binding domain-containing protein [Photobacterium sp. 1_MG-2023]